MSNITLETLHIELQQLKEEVREVKKNDNAVIMMIESKVSYKTFTWLLSILMTIILGTFAYIASQVNDVRTLQLGIGKEIVDMKIDLSKVQGSLGAYDVEFKKNF